MGHTIGRHTYHGSNPFQTWRPHEEIHVGNFCSIAEGALICAGGRHHTQFASTFPLEAILLAHHDTERNYQTTRPTEIGSDVWIGARAIITGGVHVGHGAIIGAGAVVFSRVPPYAVVAGNPAEVLFHRFDREKVKRLLKIAWWNWSDELIKERIEWFYKPIADFLNQFDPPIS